MTEESRAYQGGGGGRKYPTGKQASLPYSMYRENDASQIKVNVAGAQYYGDQIS